MSIFRQIAIVILIGALGAGGYLAWVGYAGGGATASTQRAGRGTTAVNATPATTRSLSSTVEAVGSTVAAQSVEIVPLAEGRIEEISFRAGQRVEKGDVLARLDNVLEEADLKEAKATLAQVNTELERAQSLRENNVVARATLDQLNARKEIAEAGVARAERRLADRTIRAPFSGTTGIPRQDVGARVTETTVITTLDDLSAVEVEFSVAEQLFAHVKEGQKVQAHSAAYPDRTFEGRIVEVDSRIDPVSRSFRVRAELPNPQGDLPSGMFMHITMILRSDDVVVVPEEAVIAEAGSAFVFTVEDGKAQRRQVEIGRREFGIAEVIAGIGEGTVVVVRGTNKLRDGMAISVVENEETGTGLAK